MCIIWHWFTMRQKTMKSMRKGSNSHKKRVRVKEFNSISFDIKNDPLLIHTSFLKSFTFAAYFCPCTLSLQCNISLLLYLLNAIRMNETLKDIKNSWGHEMTMQSVWKRDMWGTPFLSLLRSTLSPTGEEVLSLREKKIIMTYFV